MTGKIKARLRPAPSTAPVCGRPEYFVSVCALWPKPKACPNVSLVPFGSIANSADARMNAQPLGCCRYRRPKRRVTGVRTRRRHTAWCVGADALRRLQPKWFGLATAQPNPPDCSRVPIVAVAGRSRLSDRLLARGFPSPRTREPSISPSHQLLAPKRNQRCGASLPPGVVQLDTAQSVWLALAPAHACRRFCSLPPGGSCELPDFLSVGGSGLRPGRCCPEDPSPNFP